jgi:hypothetical protein
MAKVPLPKLPEHARRELLDDLNYLTTGEIKRFCKRHSIPYRIAMETADGRRRSTSEDDRKGVMLGRVRHFLKTGTVLAETRFRTSVVCFDALPEKLAATDRLFYGQYDKSNAELIVHLKTLTGGKFRNGAVARILMRDFWSKGEAPRYGEFARAWLKASDEHTAPNPEWAFLSDRKRKTAGPDWKKMREKKAARVLQILNRIAPTK